MSKAQNTEQPRKRTAPRDIRRKQLIMAAMDSIAKRGFSGTTLRHVTEKAELSHGVVNYHFESKEALYDATLGHLAEECYLLWTKRVSEAGPAPEHQLAAIINADFDKKVCTHKKMAVWFAFWGQAKYRPNYVKIHNKYDYERFEKIGEICSKLIQEGNYPSLDAGMAARTIEAMIDGFWLSLVLYPSNANRVECLHDCLQALAHLFPKHFAKIDAAETSALSA